LWETTRKNWGIGVLENWSNGVLEQKKQMMRGSQSLLGLLGLLGLLSSKGNDLTLVTQ
jgi:hypothetical protein